MKILMKMFASKNEARTQALDAAIQSAYKKRLPEIESLRKYDRGEKTIAPIDLRKVVRSL